MPPPPEENSGSAPQSPQAGLPPPPEENRGFAPQSPNAGLLPPPPDDRPQDNHNKEGFLPGPISPPVASGPVQGPPPASRPQAPPPYVPALLEPIRVASLASRDPSLSPGLPANGQSPGTNGSAGVFSGLTLAGSPGADGSGSVFGGSALVGPAGGPAPAGVSSGPAPDKQLCQGAEKVAQVGSQYILASDLKVAFNLWVENQKKSKKPLPPDQIERYRTEVEASLVKKIAEETMVYQDIARQVPEEALKEVRKKVTEVFETEELPKRIKSYGLGSRAELEEKLEQMGTSLEREKRSFIQTMLVQQWVQQQVKKDDETFTPDEVFAYYRQHVAEFEHTARAKWEELMVRKSRHPNRDEALGFLGRLGNQVLDGAKLSEVARAGSEGSTAREGGSHDWTTKGSLVSQTLENAIFSLPVGQLSRIIETDLGYHLVRVVNRQDQSVTPFVEAQVEIRNKIIRQRKEKQVDDYLAKLHARTFIWTKYDAFLAQQQQKAPLLFER
jgi:hypothetical protein